MNRFSSIVVLTLFGARWLGHGRKLEAFITCVALSYGISLLVVPSVPFNSPAMAELAWYGQAWPVGYALLVMSALSGYGVLANVRAWPLSKTCRFAGALLGTGVWGWFLLRYRHVGAPYALGAYFAAWAIFASIQIMAAAGANLPRPGAPGAI